LIVLEIKQYKERLLYPFFQKKANYCAQIVDIFREKFNNFSSTIFFVSNRFKQSRFKRNNQIQENCSSFGRISLLIVSVIICG